MRIARALGLSLALAVTLFGLLACDEQTPSGQVRPGASFTIVSGSENKALQPIIDNWANDNDVQIDISYLGSVDIALALEEGENMPFDAVWPANSLWIELGDSQRVVKHAKSILRSPVVFGVRKPIAVKLGWTDDPDVTIQDILDAAEAGAFRFAMTSATQSNSGASAYLGMQYAMAGNPDVLQTEHLADVAVQDQVRRLLAKVDRGSGSSGWLKETLVENPNRFDAMFNYEAMVIEANQKLIASGQDPLCAIYPTNGLMVADSPLGYIDKGDPAKEDLFLRLQEHLLSPEVQNELKQTGRRTGFVGLEVQDVDASVWNPDWCIDVKREIAPVPIPNQAVIREALDLYQTGLRKPSLTVWVLDVSSSMRGAGIDGLHRAMHTLLDPPTARRNMLQAGTRDVTLVIAFNQSVDSVWKIEGNDADSLTGLLAKTQQLEANGGTNLYIALMEALKQLQPYHEAGTLWDYLPAIVAMTDGRSETGDQQRFFDALESSAFARDIPIHTIVFGDADEQQLKQLSQQSTGRLFLSHGDLSKTLREAKGYN